MNTKNFNKIVKEIQQLKTKGENTKAETLYEDLTKTSDIIVSLLVEAEDVINDVVK